MVLRNWKGPPEAPIYRGSYFAANFAFGSDESTPLDISGWEFRSHIRSCPSEPGPPDLELTTANGGFVVTDGSAGLLLMQILAEDTTTLKVGKIVFDVLRTDAVPGPLWLFASSTYAKDLSRTIEFASQLPLHRLTVQEPAGVVTKVSARDVGV